MVSSATTTDVMALGLVFMAEDEDGDSSAVATTVGAGDDERIAPYPWDSPVTGAPNPVAADVAGADTPNPIAGVVPAPNPNATEAGAPNPAVAAGEPNNVVAAGALNSVVAAGVPNNVVVAGAPNPVQVETGAEDPKSPKVDDELPNPNPVDWP